jgi:hypothetical protein
VAEMPQAWQEGKECESRVLKRKNPTPVSVLGLLTAPFAAERNRAN